PEITQEQIIVPFKVTVSDKTGSNERSVQVTINNAVTSATTPTNASIQATPNATNATAPPPAVIPPTEAPIVPGPNVTNATEAPPIDAPPTNTLPRAKAGELGAPAGSAVAIKLNGTDPDTGDKIST